MAAAAEIAANHRRSYHIGGGVHGEIARGSSDSNLTARRHLQRSAPPALGLIPQVNGTSCFPLRGVSPLRTRRPKGRILPTDLGLPSFLLLAGRRAGRDQLTIRNGPDALDTIAAADEQRRRS